MSKKLTHRQKKKINKFILSNPKFIISVLLIITMLFVLIYFMGWFGLFEKDYHDDYLQINFLQVGQADCIVIELPNDKVMMIDTGDNSEDRTIISTFLEDNKVDQIDYLLITHSDSDHVGNADWVLENYDVNHIYRPYIYSNNEISADLPSSFNIEPNNNGSFVCESDVYARFLVSAYNENCKVEYFNKDSDFNSKSECEENQLHYTFDFLTPTADVDDIVYNKANNFSPILMLEYGKRRVVFNGDAELEVLEEYCENYGKIHNVDVLKVGHHGSSNAITKGYISAIDPEFAVIQNGIHARYKHPHQEALDILTEHEGGVTIYRTDNNGNIELTIKSNGNMSWQFDNDDMSRNLYNGSEMLRLKEEGLLYNKPIIED